jgi:limonene-1,2-epoxide hydrolase
VANNLPPRGHVEARRGNGDDMGDSPESVVRDFIASWENATVEKMSSFLSEDAVYKGPRGVQSGLDAIKKHWEADLQTTPSTTVNIKSFASNGGTVMVERVDTVPIQGKLISFEVVGVFEVGEVGLIKRFQEYYDSKSITDLIKSAGTPS